MTDDDREKLQAQLKELDEAMAKIEEARKPFDAAIMAIDGVRQSLLDAHEAEIADTCENCSRLLFVGELGHRCTDGPTLCEACAPAWFDLKRQHDDAVAKDELDDMFDTPDDAQESLDTINAHIAAGDGDKPYVWPL